MSKKHEPTPNLGKPDSRRQHFTYSENKLLDQVTTEVMEAWKKDLITIKNHHKKILEAEANTHELVDLISKEFPKLEIFLNNNSFITSFEEMAKSVEYISSFIEIITNNQNDLNKQLFDIKENLSFRFIEKTKKDLSELTSHIQEMTIRQVKLTKQLQDCIFNSNRRWWHRWIKPKS